VRLDTGFRRYDEYSALAEVAILATRGMLDDLFLTSTLMVRYFEFDLEIER
jgi:hypothetical protein